MSKFLFIAIGGSIGALLRYTVSAISYKYHGNLLPWGTLMVNLIGAFIIGFLWNLSEKIDFSPNFRAFLFVGIIGSFTTFSTYMLETFNLFRDGQFKLGLTNFLLNNVLGILLILLGLIGSRYFLLLIEKK